MKIIAGRGGNWRRLLPVACCAMLSFSLIAAGDEDDEAAASGPPAAQPSLNAEQQRAVGIAVAHPIPARAPQRIEALGVVLDATALLSDLGDSSASAAAERAAAAELARLQALYAGGAGASLKMLEAAQAEAAKAQALAQIAAARFAQHWGPLAEMPLDARQKVIQASTRGHGSAVARRFAGPPHPRCTAGQGRAGRGRRSGSGAGVGSIARNDGIAERRPADRSAERARGPGRRARACR